MLLQAGASSGPDLLSDLFAHAQSSPQTTSSSFTTGQHSLGLPFLHNSSLSVTDKPIVDASLLSLSPEFDLNLQPFGILPSSSTTTSSFPLLASCTSSSSSSSSNYSPDAALFSAPSTVLDGSPLGLFGGSNGTSSTGALSEFIVSPMFSDVDGTAALEFPPLFPATTAADLATTLAQQLNSSILPPLPPSTTTTTTSTSPCLAPSPPAPETIKPKTSRARKPKQPLSRIGSTPTVLPLDAPIQAREYLLPSATSRKRKTTPAEREIAKRLAAASTVESTSDSKDGSESPVAIDLPQDLVDAVERKRMQNTLAARKSRAKKQEKMGDLEEKNRVLVAEKEALEKKVKEYEQVLKALGVNV